jgi:hypothetical protein
MARQRQANLQDLKAGYLVGATPWRQQVMLAIGAFSCALVMAPVLNLLFFFESVRHWRAGAGSPESIARAAGHTDGIGLVDLWLQGRAAAATSLSMLDGYVTAIVAGPVSMDPPAWICPLLGIDVDAFNHGGTPEFAAISAVAVRHNTIVEMLSAAPKTFEPIFVSKPNRDIDAAPWCH